jgi:hypothetical protein
MIGLINALFYSLSYITLGARGSVVGWGHYAGRSPVQVSDEVDIFQFT